MTEFKLCKCCGENKPTINFATMGKKASGYRAPNCNQCRSASRRELGRRNKALAVEYKGGKCNDCNQVVHQAAFEFHHIDPSTKAEKSPTSKVRKEPTHFFLDGVNGLSNAAIKELDKCVLLCANCHRVRHFSDLI